MAKLDARHCTAYNHQKLHNLSHILMLYAVIGLGRRQILLIKAFLTLATQKEKKFVGVAECHFH